MAANETVYDALRDRVVNGEFLPGQRLRSEALRKDHACSASTVREALFRLSTVGLVNFQEQKGFRLPQQSAELCHDLAQFRVMLESQGACLSIRLGGVAWEARLSAAHHQLSHIELHIRSGGVSHDLLSLWSGAELEFHQALIAACGSPVLQDTHVVIYWRFRQQLITGDRQFHFVPENIEQHRGILEAALAHDEALVRERIQGHLARYLLRPLPEPWRRRARMHLSFLGIVVALTVMIS
ncbi:MAG: GntR family transcriptional regulator [Rhodobacteraceae bacterium]|nr:GntR family transcriptional regulator [Paracoccaceae bacterium]